MLWYVPCGAHLGRFKAYSLKKPFLPTSMSVVSSNSSLMLSKPLETALTPKYAQAAKKKKLQSKLFINKNMWDLVLRFLWFIYLGLLVGAASSVAWFYLWPCLHLLYIFSLLVKKFKHKLLLVMLASESFVPEYNVPVSFNFTKCF